MFPSAVRPAYMWTPSPTALPRWTQPRSQLQGSLDLSQAPQHMTTRGQQTTGTQTTEPRQGETQAHPGTDPPHTHIHSPQPHSRPLCTHTDSTDSADMLSHPTTLIYITENTRTHKHKARKAWINPGGRSETVQNKLFAPPGSCAHSQDPGQRQTARASSPPQRPQPPGPLTSSRGAQKSGRGMRW